MSGTQVATACSLVSLGWGSGGRSRVKFGLVKRVAVEPLEGVAREVKSLPKSRHGFPKQQSSDKKEDWEQK